MRGEQIVIEVIDDLCADRLDRGAEFNDVGESRPYGAAALQDNDGRLFAPESTTQCHFEPIGERAVTIGAEQTNFRTCPGRPIGRRLGNQMQGYHSAHKASKSLRAATSGVSDMAVSMPARRTDKRRSASATSLWAALKQD